MNKVLLIGGILVLAIIAVLVLRPAEPEVALPVVTDEELGLGEEMPEAAPAINYSIVDAAVATEDLSTLVAAVVAAGADEVLGGPGPFTVFAPVNSAFAALPEGTVASLLEPENNEALNAILADHVVAGAVTSDMLADGMTVTMLSGNQLPVTVSEAGVTIGGAAVVTADVVTDNGVVHLIDTVILTQ